MKIILKVICFLLIVSTINCSKTDKSIKAIYSGYEEGFYNFTVNKNVYFGFEQVSREVLKKYNLKSDEFVGKYFKVIYVDDTEIDFNLEEEIEITKIIKLELINLFRGD